MMLPRSSGVLLHITSLPGREGCGTLGREAFRFAELLHKAGCVWWQILPLGPVSPAMGYSPYSATSAFAGNFLLISIEQLTEEPWFASVNRVSSINVSVTSKYKADATCRFDEMYAEKLAALQTAAEVFFAAAEDKAAEEFTAYNAFCSENAYWLEDYALFSACAEYFGTNDYMQWDADIAVRQPEAVRLWRDKLWERISFHKFVQYVFFKQLAELKAHCAYLGVRIIGDVPIYISEAGADIWAKSDVFLPKSEGRAGVPPDYFSTEGQLWGNPLYRWFDGAGSLNEAAIEWWIARMRHNLRYADTLRLDHFRGFVAYWAVAPNAKTAVEGEWRQGPGALFFSRIRAELGELPLIAEDLGVITKDVEDLRKSAGLMGMKVLQFAFDGNAGNPYLPHNIEDANCVIYTGTHDNDTLNGWFYGQDATEDWRKYVAEYAGAEDFRNIHSALIRLVWASTARLVVAPVQDILGMGSECRMNTPGTTDGNWLWRCKDEYLTDEFIEQIMRWNRLYNRMTAGHYTFSPVSKISK